MDDAKLQLQALLPHTIRHRAWIEDMDLRSHKIAAHEHLVRAGGTPHRLYFVAKGWLSGATILSQKWQPISSVYLRSDVIGLSWLSVEKPMDDISALTAAELVSLPLDSFRDWMRRDPLLQDYVYAEMVRSMVNLQVLVAISGHMKAPDRLGYFLFIMLNRYRRSFNTSLKTLPLPMTQEQIGRLLGLTNVSVNRAFRALEADRLIETDRHAVSFLDERAFVSRFEIDKRPDLVRQLVGESLTLNEAA
ncbi:MAG: Crp/Fnr family transcriptional regulator [Pseudomonadota bacterium]